ncbi:MAG TPA: CNNM domain-containing protein [Nitrososphaerales archaeon]|nr:CNNM domain-containing protein [Nitrososphaerales archaeon]
MVVWYVYLALGVAFCVSFWMSLVEATFLTLRPLALSSESAGGNSRATKAIRIVSEKTKLVSSTTFLSTFSDVILTGTTGLIFSSYLGIEGWILTVVVVSLVIMVFLNLLPKALGIENTVRMALFLAPGTSVMLAILSPVALPLTSVARSLSQAVVGKPGYKQEDLVDEFESLLLMLEKAGHIEPDSGRILRSALASSKTTAGDLLTPIGEIVAVDVGSDVEDALRLMGKSNHPNLPVFDPKANAYVGAVTFRSLFKAFDAGGFSDNVRRYMVNPARVESDEAAATVMDKMRRAGVTMAFVFDSGKVSGMVTVTDILEVILGTKMRRDPPPAMA